MAVLFISLGYKRIKLILLSLWDIVERDTISLEQVRIKLVHKTTQKEVAALSISPLSLGYKWINVTFPSFWDTVKKDTTSSEQVRVKLVLKMELIWRKWLTNSLLLLKQLNFTSSSTTASIYAIETLSGRRNVSCNVEICLYTASCERFLMDSVLWSVWKKSLVEEWYYRGFLFLG